MNKRKLIDYLGGTAEKAALKLDYNHRNNIQRLPAQLTDRQEKVIRMRMRAAGIEIPADL